MCTNKLAFVEVVRIGATGSDVTGSHVTGRGPEQKRTGRVSSSCSTSDTSRVNLATNSVKSHE
jgi:hypothetical protein